MSIGLFAVWKRDMQYDAAGIEGTIWWIVFLIGFPFNIAREYLSETFPNIPYSIETVISYVLGSLFIYLAYRIILWIVRRKK